jgi:hypothetical protein
VMVGRRTKNAVARLVGAFKRGYTAALNPVPGATPETFVVDGLGAPLSAETAQTMPFPGCVVVPPPLCNVVVAFVREGQDPVIIAGTASPVAQKELMVMAATMPQGGIVIADPAAGINGIKIDATGVDLFGAVTVNGGGIPT